MNNTCKLVILDRDGVINFDSEKFIKTPEEFIPIPGSLEAIAKLNKSNIKVVVATNQSGIGRKLFSLETLQKIHQKLITELAKINGHIDEVIFCPHHPHDKCNCRKPKTGMLDELYIKYKIPKNETVLIGDSWRDIEAAKKFGCNAILVLTGKGQKTLAEHKSELKNIPIFETLADAIKKSTNLIDRI
ncbi:MAG: D-glycero-beta-D-manno-heptose 1,7-bisphosphate 7-phosphatase [Gammaproteobacteria bacterium]|nr:D-glycero-beta-D-manno-heptose 1,7-bisphosphate 7-phosphatase [Gammaproteobacteria bacterium]